MLPYKVDQNVILDKLQAYLRQERRDPEQINRLNEGYCDSISSLWLYAKWLQTQPKEVANPATAAPPPARDDYEWFKATTELIARWDTTRTLVPAEIAEFERFLAYIEYFQHIHNYLPTTQGELDQSLTDTKNRTLKKEYAIGALLTVAQLKALLATPGVIQEKKLIFISSHNHATALFKEHGKYYYFDANSPSGERELTNIDEVAAGIFQAHLFDRNKPSPISLRVFSLDEKPGAYPKVQPLLDEIGQGTPGGLSLEGDPSYADGVSGLMQAIQAGSLESVEYHLAKGEDPNANNMHGITPLKEAVYKRDPEIIKLLLKNPRINIDAKDPKGNTVWHYAVKLNRVNEIKALLDNIEDPTAVTKYANLVFNLAVKWGKAEIVTALLVNQEAQIDVVNGYGYTALMLAALYGHTEIAITLLAHKDRVVDINAIDRYGYTALMVAAQYGRTEIVTALLENQKVKINVTNGYGYTALMLASREGHVDIVKAFLARATHEVNVNAANAKNYNYTSLLLAAKNGHANVVITLLASEIHAVNVNATDSQGNTALMLAAKNGHANVVTAILKNQNYQVSIEGINQALLLAAKNGHARVVTTLFENHKYKVSVENINQALMLAAKNGHANVVTALLASEIHKVNINATDSQGNTALMLAANEGHVAVVAALLAHEGFTVDINDILLIAVRHGYANVVTAILKNQNYQVSIEGINQALLLAAENGHTDVVKALLASEIHKVNVNATDSQENTALMLAAENGHTDVVKALLSKLLGNKADQLGLKAVNNKGETAWSLATREPDKYSEIIKLLRPHFKEEQRKLVRQRLLLAMGAILFGAVALVAPLLLPLGLLAMAGVGGVYLYQELQGRKPWSNSQLTASHIPSQPAFQRDSVLTEDTKPDRDISMSRLFARLLQPNKRESSSPIISSPSSSMGAESVPASPAPSAKSTLTSTEVGSSRLATVVRDPGLSKPPEESSSLGM